MNAEAVFREDEMVFRDAKSSLTWKPAFPIVISSIHLGSNAREHEIGAMSRSGIPMHTHLVPAVVACRIDQDSGTDSLIGGGHEHQPLHRGALRALVSASIRLHI